jgi:MOSC domain-containing protein YiiM
MPTIIQINRSGGGVPKLPVTSAEITLAGVAGDDQHDKKHHGGPDRALCLYSLEHILALQAEGHPVFPGSTGENITLSGLEWASLQPGDRLQLGDQVVIELTTFCPPCNTIAASFQDGRFTRISQKVHPGWSRLYARVLQPGTICPGDRVGIIDNG